MDPMNTPATMVTVFTLGMCVMERTIVATIQMSSIAVCWPSTIDHFTVPCLVAWPLNESEAGGDLVLIETLLLFSC